LVHRSVKASPSIWTKNFVCFLCIIEYFGALDVFRLCHRNYIASHLVTLLSVLFVVALAVLISGSSTMPAVCGCNEAAGYRAINGDVENCQFVGGTGM